MNTRENMGLKLAVIAIWPTKRLSRMADNGLARRISEKSLIDEGLSPRKGGWFGRFPPGNGSVEGFAQWDTLAGCCPYWFL